MVRTTVSISSVAFLLLLPLFLFSLSFCSVESNRIRQQQEDQPLWWFPVKKSSDPGSDRASSAVFPLAGNVYPDGIYYATMSIGSPPKPYFMDIDTGSDLTWLQCDAPCVRCSKVPHPLYRPSKNKLVSCKDPICTYLQITGTSDENNCASPTDQCDYEIEYADSESSLGVLVSDTFSIQFTNGSLLLPNLAFGCGYDQQGQSKTSVSSTDGVLGLGLGKSGIVSQLRKQGLVRSVIGHCLSVRGGGFLFMGDTLIPPSGITWTPMASAALGKYYSPGPASLSYGKESLVSKNFKVVFDSGSSYSYFADHQYQVFITTLMRDLAGKPLKQASEDRTLPRCWKGNKPFRSADDYKRYFSSLLLDFGKKTVLELPPESYLITTMSGNACLGILNGSQAGLNNLNVIGDISLQDLLFIYDNENKRIGWARANCDRNIKTQGVVEGLCQSESVNMDILTEWS